MNDLDMLLSCFREKMPALYDMRRRIAKWASRFGELSDQTVWSPSTYGKERLPAFCLWNNLTAQDEPSTGGCTCPTPAPGTPSANSEAPVGQEPRLQIQWH